MSEESYSEALRAGLSEIPTPAASQDFDARVLAALGRRGVPGWRMLARSMRPALAGAAMSLPLMLGWVYLEPTEPGRIPVVVTAGYVEAPESLLDQPKLTAASARALTRLAGIEDRPREVVPPRSSIDPIESTGRT